MTLPAFSATGLRSLALASLARLSCRQLRSAGLASLAAGVCATAFAAPVGWQDELAPIADSDWSRARAAHLL